MLPRSLNVSLIAAHAVGFATLIRSVAFDRWITVVASLLLIVGATAALRGRTWGTALAFASAVAFPVAFAIGIAPLWFVFVGLIGALPFILASGALARFDRRATAWLAGIAAGLGASGAIAWKLVAWDLFAAFPSLRPSVFPQHGLAVLGLLVFGMFAIVAASRSTAQSRKQALASPSSRVRIADGAAEDHAAAEAEAEAAAEASEEKRESLRRRL